MNAILHYSIGMIDRLSRTTIGFLLICASFALPVTVEMFASLHLVAFYPLVTALVAWDPLLSVLTEFKHRFIEYHFYH